MGTPIWREKATPTKWGRVPAPGEAKAAFWPAPASQARNPFMSLAGTRGPMVSAKSPLATRVTGTKSRAGS